MISELSELNERRRGSNKVPIEEDKWKELSRKSSEELEQGTYMYMYEHYNTAARFNIIQEKLLFSLKYVSLHFKINARSLHKCNQALRAQDGRGYF